MRVLVDTSAYYALVDATDVQHESAVDALRRALGRDARLWTTSYVVLEAVALVQSRLGLAHVKLLREAVAQSASVVWIDGALHEAAWDELERVGRKSVSFVDCASAVVAQALGISEIFAFDPHFELWGLRVMPG